MRKEEKSKYLHARRRFVGARRSRDRRLFALECPLWRRHVANLIPSRDRGEGSLTPALDAAGIASDRTRSLMRGPVRSRRRDSHGWRMRLTTRHLVRLAPDRTLGVGPFHNVVGVDAVNLTDDSRFGHRRLPLAALSPEGRSANGDDEDCPGAKPSDQCDFLVRQRKPVHHGGASGLTRARGCDVRQRRGRGGRGGRAGRLAAERDRWPGLVRNVAVLERGERLRRRRWGRKVPIDSRHLRCRDRRRRRIDPVPLLARPLPPRRRRLERWLYGPACVHFRAC